MIKIVGMKNMRRGGEEEGTSLVREALPHPGIDGEDLATLLKTHLIPPLLKEPFSSQQDSHEMRGEKIRRSEARISERNITIIIRRGNIESTKSLSMMMTMVRILVLEWTSWRLPSARRP